MPALLVLVACGGGGGSSDPATGAPADVATAAPTTPGATPPPGPATPPATPPPGPVPPAPATPPNGLACLAKLYTGTVAQNASGAWVLRLPDNTELAWDDGKTKTFDQRLDDPDLHDTFFQPYGTGPIVANNTTNLDPGRYRKEALFKATFGDSSQAVQTKLVTVDFVGQNVKFHTRAAAALGNVSTKLKALVQATPALSAYVTGTLGGTFEWRPILNTNRMSAHSYGIAIDIVVSKSNYWEWEKKSDGTFTWANKIPQAIVDAFESEGFVWGGRWYHYDTMHFEYRPEMFDPSCK